MFGGAGVGKTALLTEMIHNMIGHHAGVSIFCGIGERSCYTGWATPAGLHRLDCVMALVPGILTYDTVADGEVFVAVDEGVLVKSGKDVLVSVRRALGGATLTLLALVREYLFISLFRACAESLASENASRLAAMQRADKNINELLGVLHGDFNQLRQSGIDEELFDVMSWFEALGGVL